MLYDNLISVLTTNIENLARMWVFEVKKSKYMKTYQTLPDEELLKRSKYVFINLIKWLESGASNEEVEQYFENVGAVRNKEGFPLSEVNYALYLVKKIFWSFSVWKDEIMGSFEKLETIEFITVLNNYFDLGDFFIIRGYFDELFNKLDKSHRFTKDEMEHILVKGAADSAIF